MYVPATAVVAVVIVSVELPAVAGFGAKMPVTPAGAPSSANVTLPAKPPVRATVMVLVAVCPLTIESDAGLAVSAKSGVDDAVTVSATVAVCAVTPVPVAVTTTEPGVAAVPAATVSVNVLDVTPAASVAGAKAAVTPVGSPVAASATSQ